MHNEYYSIVIIGVKDAALHHNGWLKACGTAVCGRNSLWYSFMRINAQSSQATLGFFDEVASLVQESSAVYKRRKLSIFDCDKERFIAPKECRRP